MPVSAHGTTTMATPIRPKQSKTQNHCEKAMRLYRLNCQRWNETALKDQEHQQNRLCFHSDMCAGDSSSGPHSPCGLPGWRSLIDPFLAVPLSSA